MGPFKDARDIVDCIRAHIKEGEAQYLYGFCVAVEPAWYPKIKAWMRAPESYSITINGIYVIRKDGVEGFVLSPRW